MNIFEIDHAIAALVDVETGEIQNYEAFEELAMARDEKIENMALLLKNTVALSTALKEEIATLQARKKVADNSVARLKEYIGYALDGQKFQTAKCSVSYRKSTAVDTDEEFPEWAKENCPDVLIEQAPKVSLTAVREHLDAGMDCPYARVVERKYLMVK